MGAINIVLQEKGPQVEFVEIETDDGVSIRIGERIPYGEFTKIRITAEDIQRVIEEG